MKAIFENFHDPLFYGSINLTPSACDPMRSGDDTDRASTHHSAATTVGGGNTSKATATAAFKDLTDASVGQTEEDSHD